MAKILMYEGLYSIDEYGNVSNDRTGRVLKQFSDGKRGYMKVKLYKGSVATTFFVHRLVAIAFVDGDTSLTVNHIDGNKLNNHFSNLEFISNADNLRHSFANGLHSEKNMGNKKGKVFAFCEDTRARLFKLIDEGASIRSVAIANNVGIKTLQYQYKNRRVA